MTRPSANTQLFLGHSSGLETLDSVLGLTIGGALTTSQQSYIGTEWADTSVHAVAQTVDFSTLFSTADTDTLLTAVLGTGIEPTEGWDFLAADSVHEMWRLIPVTFGPASYDAPIADAITRPWSLAQRDEAYYGDSVSEWETAAADTKVTVGSVSDGDEIAFVITDTGSGVTDIKLIIGSATHNYSPNNTAIHLRTAGSDDTTVQVETSGGGGAKGLFCVGQKQELPSG